MRRVIIATLLFGFGLTVGLGGPALATHIFSDVGHDDTHSDAVHWAAENGLVQGYPDGTFRPGRAVTREQLATILQRQNAYRGPVYTLTSICGTLDMQVVEHNFRGTTSASIEYSIDGGDRTEIVGAVPADGSPFVFTVSGPGVVTFFVDSLAQASTPTGETCTPPAG